MNGGFKRTRANEWNVVSLPSSARTSIVRCTFWDLAAYARICDRANAHLIGCCHMTVGYTQGRAILIDAGVAVLRSWSTALFGLLEFAAFAQRTVVVRTTSYSPVPILPYCSRAPLTLHLRSESTSVDSAIGRPCRNLVLRARSLARNPLVLGLSAPTC